MQIKLSDYISIIYILFAVVGGAFAFVQWHNSIKLKKSEYIYKLTEIIRTDKEIREIIQVFQYEVKWYDEKFHTSTFELSVDRTLAFLSYIRRCHAAQNFFHFF